MTISSTTTVARFVGNNSTTVFPYTFRILAATDLVVTKRLATTLVESTLSYPADYTVSGVGNATGGSITLTVAPATGDLLVIERSTARTQATSIRNNGSYFAETHETVFDKLTMLVQENTNSLGRTFTLPHTLDPASYNMNLPVPVAGQVPIWTTNGLTNGSISSSSVVLPGEGRDTTTLTQYLANNYVYNVLDYDADPTGVTDCSTAINKAIGIAAAHAGGVGSDGGGAVYLPGGKYLITSTINMQSNVRLIGAGHRFTTIQCQTAGIDSITIGPGVIRTVVQDIMIQGNNTNRDGIHIGAGADDCRVRNVWVKTQGRYGVYINNTPCVVMDSALELNTSDGIFITSTNSALPTKVIGCYLWHNFGNGATCDTQGNQAIFVGCEIVLNSFAGISASSASRWVKVSNCTIQLNGSHGVVTSGGSTHFTLIGCDIGQNASHGAALISSNFPVIIGCTFWDNAYQHANGFDAINLSGVTGARIIGNVFTNTDSNKWQRLGVNEGTSLSTAMTGNYFDNMNTGSASFTADTNRITWGNHGYTDDLTQNVMRTPKALIEGIGTLTYGASIAVSVAGARVLKTTVTDAVAHTFAVPTNVPAAGFTEELEIHHINASGGACAAPGFAGSAGGYVTTGATTAPANGKRRIYKFRFDQSVNFWYETHRSPSDL